MKTPRASSAGVALIHLQPRLVQLRDVAQRAGDDGAGCGAGGAGARELHLDVAGAAGEGRVDDGIEGGPRRVGDDSDHIVERHAALPCA